MQLEGEPASEEFGLYVVGPRPDGTLSLEGFRERQMPLAADLSALPLAVPRYGRHGAIPGTNRCAGLCQNEAPREESLGAQRGSDSPSRHQRFHVEQWVMAAMGQSWYTGDSMDRGIR